MSHLSAFNFCFWTNRKWLIVWSITLRKEPLEMWTLLLLGASLINFFSLLVLFIHSSSMNNIWTKGFPWACVSVISAHSFVWISFMKGRSTVYPGAWVKGKAGKRYNSSTYLVIVSAVPNTVLWYRYITFSTLQVRKWS